MADNVYYYDLEADDGQNVEVEIETDSQYSVEPDSVFVVVGGDKHYTHIQTTASDVWTISHGLQKRPSVSIVDSGGSLVVGDVTYIDDNTVRIEFSGAFSGKAYCN